MMYINGETNRHCVTYVEYLSVFSPSAGKYGPEKHRMRALFTECVSSQLKIL